MVNVQDGIIVDLSEWQGTIDFEKLSKVPNLKGAIIRVQSGYTHPDVRYKEYVAGCKKYGIPFGTYAYFRAIDVNDAIAEANSAFNLMDKDSLEFGVDIEEMTCKNPADLIPAGQAFVDRLKALGVEKVGDYSGDNFFKTYGLANIKADFHWVAAYGANDGTPHNMPSSENDLWQFTSVGRLDGISTNVDESIVTNNNLSYFTGSTIAVVPPKVEAVHTSAPAPAASAPVAPAPAPKPAPRRLYLPAKNTDGTPDNSWATFHLDKPAVKAPANIAGYLNPAEFGGLVYDIIEDFGNYVLGIQTASYGHVKIWAAPSTGAVILYPGQSTPKPAPVPVYHKVASGDTVLGLAKHFGSSEAEIKAWNHLANTDLIVIGQNLRVK